MVAQDIHQAVVTPFPQGEGALRVHRLISALARLSGASGVWRGSQGELAAELRVDVKTVGRAVADARSRGLLTTRGRAGQKYEYVLQVMPAVTYDRTPTPIRREVGADINLGQLVSEVVSEVGPEPRTVESGLARAIPLSSSSSSKLGQGTSDTSTSDTSGKDLPGTSDTPTSDTTRRDGGGGGEPPLTLSPVAEIRYRFNVVADEDLAMRWVQMSPKAKAIAVQLARENPSRSPNPSDRWLERVFTTAEERAAEFPEGAVLPPLPDLPHVVAGGGHQVQPPAPRPTAPASARAAAPPRRVAWGTVLPWAVAAAATVALLVRRGGQG